MIISIIFGILFILTFTYYCSMVSYAGLGTSFATVWLSMSVVFLAIAIAAFIFYKKGIKLPKGFKIAILSLVVVGIVFFTVIEAMVISRMKAKPENELDYIIVLGAQVRGSRITKSLSKRIDKAYDYLVANENTIAVLSGGQGKGEDISEAEAMYNRLVEMGIAADRLIMENKSENTKENVIFSMSIISELNSNARVGFVTNNFHVYRAEQIFQKLGYNVKGIAASADNKLLVNYMFREFFAVVKYKLTNSI